jgi:hypothetical protein
MWTAAAIVAFRKPAPRPGAYTLAAGAAALYASLRAVSWNFDVLEGGRSILRSLGVYDDRLWIKIVWALIVAVALVVVLHRLRSRSRAGPRLPRLALAGLLGQGLLVLSETTSLDDGLPAWLLQQPGRYVFEVSMASLVLVGLARGRIQGDE